ncbi:hypothetical protein CR513_41007, partial [Mucuna pruriens]
MAIQEVRNMKTLTLDEFLGALRVHETRQTSYKKEEKCLKAFKVEMSNALDDLSNETTNDEISLMSRKFK